MSKKDTQGFYKDFSKIQKISGFASLSAVIITILVTFFLPVESVNVRNVLWIGFYAGTFALVYYTIPSLYLNKKIAVIPDIVFTTAIAAAMFNLGEWGFLYIIFFLFIIVIDAFAYDRKNFIIVTSVVILAIIITNFFQIGTHHIADLTSFYYTSIFEIYWVLSLSVIIRLLAKESLDLRKEKDALQQVALNLEKEKKEVVTLFNALSDIIISFDKNNNINLLNKPAMAAFGFKTTEEILGRSSNKSMSIISEGKKIELARFLEGLTSRIFIEDVYLVQGKELIEYNMTVTPIFDNKMGYEGAILFMHNLSKEEELERRKIEFASIASHELRTPLAIIEGYSHLLLNGKDFSYDKGTKDYLSLINTSSRDLIDLANNILNITKIDEGKLDISPEKSDLTVILNELFKDFEPKAKEKNLKFKLNIKGSLEAITDPSRVKEIISNLVNNAIKFTDKGEVEILGKKEKGAIILSVRDTGVGIKSSAKNKVFNKFFQEEEWSTRKKGGTGLGLYISKSLSERLGGQLTFDSVAGKGTTFHLTIPERAELKNDKKKLQEKELKEFIQSF